MGRLGFVNLFDGVRLFGGADGHEGLRRKIFGQVALQAVEFGFDFEQGGGLLGAQGAF